MSAQEGVNALIYLYNVLQILYTVKLNFLSTIENISCCSIWLLTNLKCTMNYDVEKYTTLLKMMICSMEHIKVTDEK